MSSKKKPVEPEVAEPEAKGWSVDAQGRPCFGDDCFRVTFDPEEGPLMEWEDSCPVDGAKKARALQMEAAFKGKGLRVRSR